jgi:pimeloyl-ACP methyl ester carboxylesterase
VTGFALLGSPFLGPEAWAPVGRALRSGGHDVTVVGGHGATPEEVTLGFLDGLPADEQMVLVPHSNAGLYVPALAATRPVGGVVFVDAAFPGPGRTTPVAPAELVRALEDRVDEQGLLPPWTTWWPEDEVAGLLPDDTTRRAVVEGEPRVPASYLSGRVSTPPGWETGLRAGYLAFGKTYALELALAREWEWPVAELDGGHLHQLVDPAAVAAAIVELATRAGAGAG